MDVRDQLLVVGTAEQPAPPQPATSTLNAGARQPDRTRKIYCFNLKSPTQPLKVEASPLQYQTRCVAAFHGNAGYLVGSIEGRVGVQNFEGMHPDKQPSYTFKCHRRTLDAQGNIAQNAKQVRDRDRLAHPTSAYFHAVLDFYQPVAFFETFEWQ
jgi:hypothetical protein